MNSTATADVLSGDHRDSVPTLPRVLLESELQFYGKHQWTVNPCPTVREVFQRLREQLSMLQTTKEQWQRAEIANNIFLLSGAISNAVDDYLRGTSFELPVSARNLLLARAGLSAAGWLQVAWQRIRLSAVRKWRKVEWEKAVVELFSVLLVPDSVHSAGIGHVLDSALNALERKMPRRLLGERIKIPSAFRGQDLTHFDVLELGRKFVAVFPDHQQPILLLGLRTSGSYFAPVLRAYLRNKGYLDVQSATIRTDKGIGYWEVAELKQHAARGAMVLILDDPPGTGGTIISAVELLLQSGFPTTRITALLPIHPSGRNWREHPETLPLARICIVSLYPEEWYKFQLLKTTSLQFRLDDYFRARGYRGAEVVASSSTANRFNCELDARSEQGRRTRLKRIYEVRLVNHAGKAETRYILAKSVGWGWLSYGAFLAAAALSEFIAPAIGLRNGIFYAEWLPQTNNNEMLYREHAIERAASYVAARVRSLPLGVDPLPELLASGQHKGFVRLSEVLSKAYGWKVTSIMRRARLRNQLALARSPVPTLIDGKMRMEEWIRSSGFSLKTDFEHHGMGKNELNVADPAYDLAVTMLSLGLSEAEEGRLIDRYVDASGDANVRERLFLFKLLAGTTAVTDALSRFSSGTHSIHHPDGYRDYLQACRFLIVQTARFCGRFCGSPQMPSLRSLLVVLDIDGVLDRRIFGFPSTTAAGIRAIRLLHSHNIAVALNTARSLAEVKEYCNAYGLTGGVAEYGSVVWDARRGIEKVLVGDQVLKQLVTLRSALRNLPGVFVNPDFDYSIQACTFENGASAPIPRIIVEQLATSLGLDLLRIQQNSTDTVVVSRETDKGTGLRDLLEFIGASECQSVAIGDSESDLPMFAVAQRSFAPAQIWCASWARRLGCQIAPLPYQNGLLSIVRLLIHPDGKRCRCCACFKDWPAKGSSLFLDLLEVADGSRPLQLLQALRDPISLQAFTR
jgi:hydroxymethylpyrimidine pyrophosphatase-like HAD family hydrolase